MFTSRELGLEDPSIYEQRATNFEREASACRDAGDQQGLADALLGLGWAREKLGDGATGLRLAGEAREFLREQGNQALLAECCHTIAVWSFHHIDGAESVVDFAEAATLREAIGDHLLAAQSWHNMAYVQLMHGKADDANEAYSRASALLDRVESGPEPERAATAVRQRAFVLSHLAFTRARHGSCDQAIEATAAYFRYVEMTGHHREPVLAFLAPGIALDSRRGDPGLSGPELERRSGIPLKSEYWLRRSVDEASMALKSPTSKRPAYLGSHLLALGELAAWCARQGQVEDAIGLTDDAISRASARGWSGEAERLERQRRHWNRPTG